MHLSTRQKIALARAARAPIVAARRLAGSGDFAVVRRGGIRWSLDLREGIDFAIYLFGVFERSTRAAYRRLLREGSVAVDIGANMGAHTMPLAACVGASGRVLAFEPTRGAFDRLARNIALNPTLAPRITAAQVLLVERPDAALEPAIAASWPLAAAADGAHPLHRGVLLSTAGASAATLDDALASRGIKRVDLIKLDVDGHELDVLAGGRLVLARERPAIIMEMSPYTLEERGQSMSTLVEMLAGLGYRFSDLRGRPFADTTAMIRSIPAGYSINVIATASRPR